MIDAEIESVDAWEVLDSRGEPTVRVRVEAGGSTGTFTVPSGASTGTHEVLERRDGGERYGGKGVREAVTAVREDLGPLVVGRDATEQEAIDADLVGYDGTETLSRIGGNAVLGVSGAVTRAASAALGEPLYEYFASLASTEPGRIPLPMVNILSGGLHATGGIEIQDFLVVPAGASSYPDALETVHAVRSAVRDRITAAGHRPLVADEGGFAPPLESIDEAFELLAGAVRDAGHAPSRDDVAFAVDVAATHFHDGDRYDLESVGRSLTSEGMIESTERWVEEYPVVSIEDPLAEDDWDGWRRLTDRLGSRVAVVGDDLLVTNPDRLNRAIDAGAANAVLVKPNQAGTVTRTLEVIDRAREAGWRTVVSARSGETCDSTIADLAVGCDAGQIKIGSLARSERLAKYNRLTEIDREHDGGFADGDPGRR